MSRFVGVTSEADVAATEVAITSSVHEFEQSELRVSGNISPLGKLLYPELCL